MFKTDFPKALGVCTCNIFNGLSPSSRNGDASISYGADACNTPNYMNILSIILSIIVVYVSSLVSVLGSTEVLRPPQHTGVVYNARSSSRPCQWHYCDDLLRPSCHFLTYATVPPSYFQCNPSTQHRLASVPN